MQSLFSAGRPRDRGPLAIEHVTPVRLAGNKRGPRHSWIMRRVAIPTQSGELWGLLYHCEHCPIERLVLVNALAEIVSKQYRQPGRTNWATLTYLKLSCPPSPQELLSLERIADSAE